MNTNEANPEANPEAPEQEPITGVVEAGIEIPPDRRTFASKVSEMQVSNSMLVRATQMPRVYTLFKRWRWKITSRAAARSGPLREYVRFWRTG